MLHTLAPSKYLYTIERQTLNYDCCNLQCSTKLRQLYLIKDEKIDYEKQHRYTHRGTHATHHPTNQQDIVIVALH